MKPYESTTVTRKQIDSNATDTDYIVRDGKIVKRVKVTNPKTGKPVHVIDGKWIERDE